MLNRHRRAAQKQAAELDRAEGEAACLFVGSKGLMKLCETHQPLPNDAAQQWPLRALRNHRPGGRIYVHATAIEHFVRRALGKISSPFVLVTGDSVVDVGTSSLGEDVVAKILAHPHLVRWHAQNLAIEHEKAQPMPLGLDYHTISRRRRPGWGPGASPLAQEELLHTVRLLSRPLPERRALGYSNWHFVLGNGDRAEVIKALPAESSNYETARIPRAESWRRNTEFFFTISPRGRGMDCHRTWEAILLGSVPLIPDLPINALFQTLPVVVVRDWASVTPAFLAAERERILDEDFDFAPVLLETWKRRLFGRDDLPSLRMRYQDFMRLDPRALRGAIS